MQRLNQVQVYQQRQRVNWLLFVVFCFLFAWVVFLLYHDRQQRQQLSGRLSAVDQLTIERTNDTIRLEKKSGQWFVQHPYHSLASQAVVETLLARLMLSCRGLSASEQAMSMDFLATLKTAKQQYQIGELNTMTDEVYIRQGTKTKTYHLCDKLIASIALAPALNFINKQLYQGELTMIKGSFGQLGDFTGLDLSVLQVVLANAAQVQATAISTLTFVTDSGLFAYSVLPPTADNQYLMLYEPEKKLIYAIAAHEKLIAILGL